MYDILSNRPGVGQAKATASQADLQDFFVLAEYAWLREKTAVAWPLQVDQACAQWWDQVLTHRRVHDTSLPSEQLLITSACFIRIPLADDATQFNCGLCCADSVRSTLVHIAGEQ